MCPMLYEAKEGTDQGIMTILFHPPLGKSSHRLAGCPGSNCGTYSAVLGTAIHFAIVTYRQVLRRFIPHVNHLMPQGCDFSFQPSNGLRSNHRSYTALFSRDHSYKQWTWTIHWSNCSTLDVTACRSSLVTEPNPRYSQTRGKCIPQYLILIDLE